MADVFISYKREDRARVQPLIEALEAEGLSVWWDMSIQGGAAWRQSIQTALDGAKCVIVAWSVLSIGPEGEFVHDEASRARRRGAYLPICIDAVDPPLGFGQVHALPLVGWKGRRKDPVFQKILAAARALVAGERGVEPAAETSASAPIEAAAHEKPSIAVLPFKHPPGGEDTAYFAEGVAEELIAGLARSRMLAVTPRQSSLTYDPKGADAARISADLGAEYIVQGHVRRLGKVVRVSVELVNGPEEKTVWSARYDRPIDDLFAVQDEITASIVGTLEPALLGHEETQSLQARNLRHWDLFMRGRWHFWRSTIEDGAKAREFLLQALALEPDDVPTLCLLSLCHMGDVWAGAAKNPAESIAKAHRMALKAVALDDLDAFAHNILGIALSLMGRIDHAMAEQRRALELNPYLAAAAGELGRLFVFAGRLEESIAYSDRAIAASPNDPHAFLWFRTKALACFIAQRYDEAARHAADACARSPHQFFLHYLLTACHAAGGNLARARIALEEGRRLQPRYTLEMLKLGHPFADPEHSARFIDALKAAGWDGLNA